MLLYFDTETTGTEKEDRLCQLAYKESSGVSVNELFKPPVPIKAGAVAIHKITEKMVADKPAFHMSPTKNKFERLITDPNNILVAHNAEFDVGMLRKEGLNPERVICSLRLIRFLDSQGELYRHNLQYLRDHFEIDVDATAHDAMGDVFVLEKLFEKIMNMFEEKYPKENHIQMMLKISNYPVLLPKIPFGMYQHLHFKDVPTSYLKWMKSKDFTGDLLYTVNHYLDKRFFPVLA